MITSVAFARGAWIRQESRGGHTRADFEGERDEWLQYNIVIKQKDDGSMDVQKVDRGDPPEKLSAMARADLEDLESGKVG